MTVAGAEATLGSRPPEHTRAANVLLVGGASPLPSSVDIVADALRQANSRGLRTTILNSAANLAATESGSSLARNTATVDPESVTACSAWAEAAAEREERYDLVLGLRDPVLDAAAACAQMFAAAGPRPDQVRLVRDKDVCRAALAAAGFAQPAVQLCRGLADAERFLHESTGPWVIKPRAATGSVGVTKVDSAADLARAVAALPDPGWFLAEEFVEGPEFSAEGVLLKTGPRVLAVTAKEKLPPPYFVELSHTMPAELPDEQRREIETQVCGALTALGLRTGVFHVELWLTDRGVVLGEVHIRPGGDWLHRLLRHVIPGLELFGLLYDDLLGREPEPAASLKPVRGATARFLTAPPGRLLRVEGWEAVQRHPAVLFAGLSVEPGAVIHEVRDSGDRAGVIVVGSETPAEAKETARRLAESVRFVIAPDRRPNG